MGRGPSQPMRTSPPQTGAPVTGRVPGTPGGFGQGPTGTMPGSQIGPRMPGAFGGTRPAPGTMPGRGPGATGGTRPMPGTMPGVNTRPPFAGGTQTQPGGSGAGWHGNQWNGHNYQHGYYQNGHYNKPYYSNGGYYYNYPYVNGWYLFGSYLFGFATGYALAAPYSDYGVVAPYVYAPSVVVVPQPYYTYYDVPAYDYGNDYYMSPGAYTGLNAALDDIRNGWIGGNDDLILKHINPSTNVAIYLDGKYSYSVPGNDYSKMTRDALGAIKTVDLSFYKVQERSDGSYIAYGKHEFNDESNNRKVVYISYTLSKSNGNWLITAAGSSDSELG